MADRANTTLVTFEVDIYPYCKGDCVELDKSELERVDKVAKARDISKPYSKGEVEVNTPSLEEQEVARVEAQREAAAAEASVAATEKEVELDRAAEAAPEAENAEEVAAQDEPKAEKPAGRRRDAKKAEAEKPAAE